jgi:DNA-binding CsgD family transcriptional regulator
MNLIQQIFQLSHQSTNNPEYGEIGNLPYHTFTLDKQGQVLACNDLQAQSVGASKESDIVGTKSYELVTPDEGEKMRVNNELILTRENVLACIEEYTRFDGKKMLAHSLKIPLRSRMNKIIGVMGLSFIEEKFVTNENIYMLTQRQQDCLYYLARGFTVKQIATALKISSRTVEHHMEAIKLKLVITRRSDLIAKALELADIKHRIMNDC